MTSEIKYTSVRTDGLNDHDILIQESLYLRGLFVHRYAGIEFSINELLVRARLLDEYQGVGDLPFIFEKRLARLLQMLDMPGPLQAYRDVFRTAVEDLKFFGTYRHLMVHGLMAFSPEGSGEETVRFRLYNHQDGGLSFGSLDLPIGQFRELVDRLMPLSSGFTGLVARICREVPLPLVSIEPTAPPA